MDPISALALGCNVLDLLERGWKSAVAIKQIYDSKSGVAKETEVLLGEVNVLADVAEKLNSLGRDTNRDGSTGLDDRMKEVSTRCLSAASAIQSKIDKLRPKREKSLRSSVAAFVRMAPEKSAIEELQRELKSGQEMMNSLVITKILRDVARLKSQMETSNQQMEQEMRKSRHLVLDRLGVLGDRLDGLTSQPQPVLEQIKQVSEAAANAVEGLKIAQILASLQFPDMNDRFATVSDAAPDTFDWVFDDPEIQLFKQHGLEISFPAWLESGSGIFHIEGKPGSGKSTVMKHFCEHPTTYALLQRWAGDKQLIFGQFFFWKPGNPEGKSLRGLVRSLLYRVIDQEPQLARHLFPQYLAEGLKHRGIRHSMTIQLANREISKAFDQLVANPQLMEKHCLCFFIDGLDEFEENTGHTYSSLTKQLLTWVSGPLQHVKLCVSSRQFPVFTKAFPPSQRLTMQMFTFRDITKLVRQRLFGHERFKALAEEHSKRCRDLVSTITAEADGVFLWVCIMLNQLETALDNDESIKMLENIVSSAPTDMDEFLRFIINSIPFMYQKQALTLLAVALRLRHYTLPTGPSTEVNPDEGTNTTLQLDLSLLSCSFLMEGLESTSLDSLIKTEPPPPETVEGYDARINRAGKQIDNRCKGLLERRGDIIKFTHRSVPEFLVRFLWEKSDIHRLNNRIILATLAWMMLVDASYLKPPKPLSRRSFLNLGGDLNLKHITQIIASDEDQDGIGEEPYTYTNKMYRDAMMIVLVELARHDDSCKDSDLLFPILRRIDQKLIQRRGGVSTLEQTYQLYRNPATFQLSSLLLTETALGQGIVNLPEYILWDHKNEKQSLIKGQAWFVTKRLSQAVADLNWQSMYAGPGSANESLNILLDYFLTTGEVSVTAVITRSLPTGIHGSSSVWPEGFPNYQVPPHIIVQRYEEGKAIEPSAPTCKPRKRAQSSKCLCGKSMPRGFFHIMFWDFFILTLLSELEKDVHYYYHYAILLCGHLVPTDWKALQIWFNHGVDMPVRFKLGYHHEEEVEEVEIQSVEKRMPQWACRSTRIKKPRFPTQSCLPITTIRTVRWTIIVVRQNGTVMMEASGIQATEQNEPILRAIWKKITESPSRSISLREFLLLQLPEDSEVPAFLVGDVQADGSVGDTPTPHTDNAVEESFNKASEMHVGDEDTASLTTDRSRAPGPKVSTGTELSGVHASLGSANSVAACNYLLAILVALVTGYYIASHSYS